MTVVSKNKKVSLYKHMEFLDIYLFFSPMSLFLF